MATRTAVEKPARQARTRSAVRTPDRAPAKPPLKVPAKTPAKPPAGSAARGAARAGGRRSRSWSERELRLVDRLAELHAELDSVQRDRAGLIAYVLRLHAGSVAAPDAEGWSAVHVDTAAGRLSWRVAPEDADLFQESEAAEATGGAAKALPEGRGGDRERSVETLTRLSFLHLHRRPNRPARKGRRG